MIALIKYWNSALGDVMDKIKKLKAKLEKNIVFRVAKITCYVLILLLLFVIIIQRFSNNSLSLGGVRIFTVASGSMQPEYNIGDILISKRVDAENINVGDNITYIGEKGPLNGIIITHKVIDKSVKEDGVHFITKGTANVIQDPEIRYDQVYGKVVYKFLLLSVFGKIMNNKLMYYLVFMFVAVIISVEIISSMFAKDEDDEGK